MRSRTLTSSRSSRDSATSADGLPPSAAGGRGAEMFHRGIEHALEVALQAHEGQVRKGRAGVPYVVHPLHVALLLARLGAEPEVIQAGLLHDVVEDSQLWSLERVEAEFGPRVRTIVAELSGDTTLHCMERKQRGVARVAGMSRDAALVKGCDKLHNLCTLAEALDRAPDPAVVWGQFKGGRDQTLALAEMLVSSLAPRVTPELGEALRSALALVSRPASFGSRSGG